MSSRGVETRPGAQRRRQSDLVGVNQLAGLRSATGISSRYDRRRTSVNVGARELAQPRRHLIPRGGFCWSRHINSGTSHGPTTPSFRWLAVDLADLWLRCRQVCIASWRGLGQAGGRAGLVRAAIGETDLVVQLGSTRRMSLLLLLDVASHAGGEPGKLCDHPTEASVR